MQVIEEALYMDRVRDRVLKDIEQFNLTGELPHDTDVRLKHGANDSYWGYVRKHFGGVEPLWNSLATNMSDVPKSRTNNGAKFVVWLETEYPRLSLYEKQLFQMAFVERLQYIFMAERLNVSEITIKRHMGKLKRKIKSHFV